MKFFAHFTVSKNSNCKDPSMLLGRIYGPYENDTQIRIAIRRNFPDQGNLRFLILEGSVMEMETKTTKSSHEKNDRENGVAAAEETTNQLCKNCGVKMRIDRSTVPPIQQEEEKQLGTYRYKMVLVCTGCGLKAPASEPSRGNK